VRREEGQAMAGKIAKNSPAAMRATKRALWGALELGLTDACRAGAGEIVSMWGHPDQEEGPRAVAEKREPHPRAARPEVGPSRPGGGPAGVRREAGAELAGSHRALTFAGRFPDQSGLTY